RLCARKMRGAIGIYVISGDWLMRTASNGVHRSSPGLRIDSRAPGRSFSQQLARLCKSRCEKPEGTQKPIPAAECSFTRLQSHRGFYQLAGPTSRIGSGGWRQVTLRLSVSVQADRGRPLLGYPNRRRGTDAVLQLELERAFTGGHEASIHLKQLLAGPTAALLQLIKVKEGEALKHKAQRCSTTRCPVNLHFQPEVGYSTPMAKSYTPGFFPIDDAPTPPPTARVTDDYVILRGHRVLLASDIGTAFVSDCARNREKIFCDSELKEKYQIDDKAWTEIIANKALKLAVLIECQRRVLNNDASRESAAREFVKAPAILGAILDDPKASPRAKVAISQELRASARANDEKTRDTPERFVISISFGPASNERVTFTCDPPKQPARLPDAEDQW